RAERMSTQTRFSKFDAMLVTIVQCAIDQRLSVLFALIEVLCDGPCAKACIKRAARLPRVTQRRACRGVTDVRDHAAERCEAGDSVNENDRRQHVMGVCQINPCE